MPSRHGSAHVRRGPIMSDDGKPIFVGTITTKVEDIDRLRERALAGETRLAVLFAALDVLELRPTDSAAIGAVLKAFAYLKINGPR